MVESPAHLGEDVEVGHRRLDHQDVGSFLDVELGGWDLRLGRQAINFGQALIWNPVDLGYAAVYVTRAVVDGKLNPGDASVEAGRLGTLQVVEFGPQNLQGCGSVLVL